MCLPRLRFTIGRWMALVAVLAVLIAAGVYADKLARRSAEYRQRAARFARGGATARGIAEDCRALLPSIEKLLESQRKLVAIGGEVAESTRQSEAMAARMLKNQEAEVRHYEEVIAWSARLEATYDRAARRPWIVVPPDPPMPKRPTRDEGELTSAASAP